MYLRRRKNKVWHFAICVDFVRFLHSMWQQLIENGVLFEARKLPSRASQYADQCYFAPATQNRTGNCWGAGEGKTFGMFTDFHSNAILCVTNEQKPRHEFPSNELWVQKLSTTTLSNLLNNLLSESQCQNNYSVNFFPTLWVKNFSHAMHWGMQTFVQLVRLSSFFICTDPFGLRHKVFHQMRKRWTGIKFDFCYAINGVRWMGSESVFHTIFIGRSHRQRRNWQQWNYLHIAAWDG